MHKTVKSVHFWNSHHKLSHSGLYSLWQLERITCYWKAQWASSARWHSTKQTEESKKADRLTQTTNQRCFYFIFTKIFILRPRKAMWKATNSLEWPWTCCDVMQYDSDRNPRPRHPQCLLISSTKEACGSVPSHPSCSLSQFAIPLCAQGHAPDKSCTHGAMRLPAHWGLQLCEISILQHIQTRHPMVSG